jgi:Rrf2 family protein
VRGGLLLPGSHRARPDPQRGESFSSCVVDGGGAITREGTDVRISAKADYAVRAAVELAAAPDPKPIKAERIATNQGIPLNFLENILAELRHAGIVRSHRGADGGFRLAKDARDVTVADVIRAVEGPLAMVRGGPPEDAAYGGSAHALPRVWIAVRKNLRNVVEHVTLADIAAGELPAGIERLADEPEAWVTR